MKSGKLTSALVALGSMVTLVTAGPALPKSAGGVVASQLSTAGDPLAFVLNDALK